MYFENLISLILTLYLNSAYYAVYLFLRNPVVFSKRIHISESQPFTVCLCNGETLDKRFPIYEWIAKIARNLNPTIFGLHWFRYVASTSKSHCGNSISCKFLQFPHQVDMKNILKRRFVIFLHSICVIFLNLSLCEFRQHELVFVTIPRKTEGP